MQRIFFFLCFAHVAVSSRENLAQVSPRTRPRQSRLVASLVGTMRASTGWLGQNAERRHSSHASVDECVFNDRYNACPLPFHIHFSGLLVQLTALHHRLMQHTIAVRTPCRAVVAPPAASSDQQSQPCTVITRRGFTERACMRKRAGIVVIAFTAKGYRKQEPSP